jgi:hypothetical protein
MVLAVISPTGAGILVEARVARISFLLAIVPFPTSQAPSWPWRPIRQRLKDNADSSQIDLPVSRG